MLYHLGRKCVKYKCNVCRIETATYELNTTKLKSFKKNNITSNKVLQTNIHGCFFHLSQGIWKYIQEYDLCNQYCCDPVFALELRKLAALAFVSIEKLQNI